jgi:YegS/Rv2252/BmrU family lipid kinase
MGPCLTDSAIRFHNTTLIFNPAAGQLRGKGRARLVRVRQLLADAGHRITMSPTTGPGTADGIARKAIENGSDLIIAAGGDGTLNEVMNGMVHTAVPLAIMPAGTANVLATELGIGRNMEHAGSMIPKWVERRIAVGRLDCEGRVRHFLSMTGVGFDAHIVYNLSASLKSRFGKGAYWISGFSQAVRRYPEFEVETEMGRRLCSFALVSRVKNYGGDFEIARSASLLDDSFEAVMFEGRHALPYLKYVCGMIVGRLGAMRGVTFLRAKKLRVSHPTDSRVYIQCDGEYAGRLPASIHIIPDALTLLVPPVYVESQGSK